LRASRGTTIFSIRSGGGQVGMKARPAHVLLPKIGKWKSLKVWMKGGGFVYRPNQH